MSKSLTQEERYYIKMFLESKNLNYSEIARRLSRHKSTISREINRNRGREKYSPKQAHSQAIYCRKNALKKIKFNEEIKEKVIALLRSDLSPEQISNRLKLIGVECVSHERIYQYIWDNKKRGGNLFKNLRRKNKKYQKRGNYNDNRGVIADKISIEERPIEVETRQTIGHWEADLVCGKSRSGYLVTATERKSNFNVIGYVGSKNSWEVAKEIIRMLTPLKDSVKTITTDNGKEFKEHKWISKKLQANYYFAHPYCSSERGTNENANGLIRQYFPKNMSFTKSQHIRNLIPKALTLLNNRPRKMNGYLTPKEVFLNEGVATVS